MKNRKLSIVKIQCGKCGGGLRNHTVLAQARYGGEMEEAGFWWGGELQICQCMGCDEHRFRRTYRFSEDVDEMGNLSTSVDIYPESKAISRTADPDLLRIRTVGAIYKETVQAMATGMPILCAGGLRAVVEAICREQGIRGKSLQDAIETMAQRNLLTRAQADFLHEERFLGNAALHEIAVPSTRNLELGLEITEGLMRTLYVLPKKAAELKAARLKKKKPRTS